MWRLALLSLLGASFFSVLASAQEPTPDDVQSAAAAFGEAQRAQLRGDYAQAADLFELADRSAPNAVALRSAIRNRRAASQASGAATLAAEALTRYPDDAETHALAEETLAELAPTLAALHVTCAPACSLSLDGRAANDRALERFDLYVAPGEHEVAASWGSGAPLTRALSAVAAQEESFAFEAPPVEAVVAEVIPEGVAAPEPPPEPPPPPPSGLHPAIFGSLAGLAVLGLGITIGSGVDTLDAASAYRSAPTQAGYEDGIGRELRTNVLIGVTSAVAVTALVLLFFTNWEGDGPSERVALLPSFSVSPDGASLALAGRL